MLARRTILRRLSMVAAAAAVAGASVSAHAANVTLRYSNWLPGHHPLLKGAFIPWFAEIEKVTNGRVKVETLPKVVGSVPKQFDVARDGLADITFVINGYTAGRLKAYELLELPFLGDSAEALAVAGWRIHQKYLAKLGEYKGTVPMAIFTHGPGCLLVRGSPINSIADFKGKKIRVASAAQVPIIEALGAVPVQRPVTKVYEVLSTGVVDGSFLSREAIKNFNIGRAVNQALVVPGGFYNLSMSLVIGERAWRKISKADQAAIMKISGEALGRKIGSLFPPMDEAGLQDVVKNGGTVTPANTAFVNDLRKAFKSADEAWYAKAKQAGLKDPASVLAEFRATVAREQK
ncbi:MAG: TRAP transporter substrate-binding protein [Burkholderiaceae bacterium]|nr:TRAP transporter substrate-binding protein [Burkholderiaceae bacterium]